VRVDNMEAAGGLRIRQREARGEVWAKNPKPSIHRSVLGVPCEKAVWDDAEKWWLQVDGMVAAGGLRVCQREAGGQGLGQKSKTEHSSLGFGCAM
jgi:hypothetical protein